MPGFLRRFNMSRNTSAMPNRTADYDIAYGEHWHVPALWKPGVTRRSLVPFNQYPQNANEFRTEIRLQPPHFVQPGATLRAINNGIRSNFARPAVTVAMPQIPRR